MNKQELIEKVKSLESFNSSYAKDFAWGFDECRNGVLSLIQALDEPQKVKVPAFVADYIKWCWDRKWQLHTMVMPSNAEYFESHSEPSGLHEWINENYATFLIAIATGDYEVEQEPKWKIINDQKYCLTSIEAGYGNSLHWAFDSTKKNPILFDNEETALYTAYITGGTVEKV